MTGGEGGRGGRREGEGRGEDEEGEELTPSLPARCGQSELAWPTRPPLASPSLPSSVEPPVAGAVDLSPGFFFLFFFGVGKRAGLLWDDPARRVVRKKKGETLPRVIRIGVLWVGVSGLNLGVGFRLSSFLILTGIHYNSHPFADGMDDLPAGL